MPDLDELLRADAATWRMEVDALRPEEGSDGLASGGRPRRVMQWCAPLAAATLILLVAAGIGYLASRGDHSGTREPALPVLSTSGTRVDSLKPVAPARVAAASKRARPVHVTDAKRGGWNDSMRWSFLALLDNGRTILVSYVRGDPCDRPLGFGVQQGSNAVELTALSNVHHGGCEQSLLGAFGTIRLDRPLGNRLLLHAPTDRH